MLELTAGVGRVHLVDQLVAHPGQPGVHGGGLRKPGGNRPSRLQGLALVLVDRAVEEEGLLEALPFALCSARFEVLTGELETLREEAGEEDDAVGDLPRQLECARLARRDEHGRRVDRREEVRRREPPRADVPVDRLAAPERAKGSDRLAKGRQLCHRQPELPERPVTDTDAAGHPAGAEVQERAECVGGDPRMSCQWVRDRRPHADPGRRLQRQRRVDVAVAGVQRRVGDPEVVEPE
jgi:hypothetical protein